MTVPSVRLETLSRRFGEDDAVRSLSFEVQHGELFGLVGPDGAGKTTTLRMLSGILRPTSGDALVAGISVRDDPEGVKPHIAYVAQRFGLYTDLTVRENIDFYADLFGVPGAERAQRYDRLYGFSGLGPFANRLAGQLSGGMKQKLSLSCALVHQPAIMILDEPTFGVDPISRRDLWLIIHEMVSAGTTVIVSTAYLDEAERCDRVAMLHKGNLVALDQPDALRGLLRGRLYSLRAPTPRATRAAIREIAGVRQAKLFGDAIHINVEDVDRWPLVEQALHEIDHTFTASAREPSLEDVFMDLVASAATND
jgi:ABC-2 type transport system ATP-binding protein